MGSSNSRRRAGMSDRTSSSSSGRRSDGSSDGQLAEDSDTDLANILSALIRSGQVRILSSSSFVDDFFDDEEEEEDSDFVGPASPPTVDPKPDTSGMDVSEFREELLLQLGHQNRARTKRTLHNYLRKREVGMGGRQQFSRSDCCQMSNKFLPNSCNILARYPHKAFCGTFSQDGNIFLSACQDQNIRIYDTRNGSFREFKKIRARDVGWSVLDTTFSPDGNYMIYSSWSDSIHICNIHGDYDTHNALNLVPQDSRFCVFSLMFSMDNKEILGGASDGCLYVYDREINQRTLKIDAHDDDVNAVAFADDASQILFSGGDDGLLKVWDRRTLSEDDPQPVGVLAGHYDGITYIDSKGDGRYLLSNCKDQTIKLWDIRKFSSRDAQEATKMEVAKQRWDYRWQSVPRKVSSRTKRLPGDTSLMTYRGHSVLHTLIRAHFSPQFTTGQQFIYTGCATGSVVIYDVLTGQIVSKLEGHRACVRDVSWHPNENKIMSTSWDGSVGLWTYSSKETMNSDSEGEEEDDDKDCEDRCRGLRRSKRIQAAHHRSGLRRRPIFQL